MSGISFARFLLVPALGSLSACLSVAFIATLSPTPADGVTAGTDAPLEVALVADEAASQPDEDQPIAFDRLVGPRGGQSTTTAPTTPPTNAGGSFTDQGAPAPFGVTSVTSLSRSGIPLRAYKAYLQAQGLMASEQPNCHLNWSLLAGIGRVESNHGRFGGAGFTADGRVSPPIYGVALDGSLPGTAVVRDSDDGAYDADSRWDRAVGPMQFLPRSWDLYGGDANGDGQRDPQQIDDAVYGAGRYLCSGGGDLGTYQGQYAAVYRYNHSDSYVRLVLSLAATYASGQAVALPDAVPEGAHTGAEGPGASPTGEPPGITPEAEATTSTTSPTEPGSPVTLAPTTVTSVIATTTTTAATSGGTTTTGGSTSGAASTTTAATTTTTRPTTASTIATTTSAAPSSTATTAAPTTTTTRASSTTSPSTASTSAATTTTVAASSTVTPIATTSSSTTTTATSAGGTTAG